MFNNEGRRQKLSSTLPHRPAGNSRVLRTSGTVDMSGLANNEFKDIKPVEEAPATNSARG